jgi:hypothetical protein
MNREVEAAVLIKVQENTALSFPHLFPNLHFLVL